MGRGLVVGRRGAGEAGVDETLLVESAANPAWSPRLRSSVSASRLRASAATSSSLCRYSMEVGAG